MRDTGGMAPLDDDEDPRRTLLTALGAMAAVAVAVGLVVGLVAVGALGGLGGDGAADGEAAAPETLFIPTSTPKEGELEEWPGLPSYSPPPSSTEPAPSDEATPKRDKITLFAAPQSVSPGERINFNGVYLDGEGVALRVQRRDGGVWSDFAGITAQVRGGVFETWIQTSRTGETSFRVLDPSTERTSNVVTVTIG